MGEKDMKLTLLGALAIGGLVVLLVALIYFLRKGDGGRPEQDVNT